MKVFYRSSLALLLAVIGCTTVPQPETQTPPVASKSVAPVLRGVEWVLDLDCLEGVKGERPENAITLEFDTAQNRLYGCSGINRYFGPVQLDSAGALTLGTVGATLMMGPGLGYEQAYLERLNRVTRYELRGEKLVLYAGEAPVLRYFVREDAK